MQRLVDEEDGIVEEVSLTCREPRGGGSTESVSGRVGGSREHEVRMDEGAKGEHEVWTGKQGTISFFAEI